MPRFSATVQLTEVTLGSMLSRLTAPSRSTSFASESLKVGFDFDEVGAAVDVFVTDGPENANRGGAADAAIPGQGGDDDELHAAAANPLLLSRYWRMWSPFLAPDTCSVRKL